MPKSLRRDRSVLEELQLDLPAHDVRLETAEKDLILKALKKWDWNQTHAARYLDISRKTLIYRMEKHGIQGE